MNENTMIIATVNNNTTNNMEDNTMMNEAMNNATTNNSNKEEKKMTFKERWMANIHKGQDLGCKAANKTGYGLGYATTTVKAEVAYAARKVAKAVSETRVAEEFTDGYYNGKNDAGYAFAQRCAKRDEKAREKANAKAAEAAQEMIDELDEALCGAQEMIDELDETLEWN